MSRLLRERVCCTSSGVRSTPPKRPIAVPSAIWLLAKTPLPLTGDDFTSTSEMLHPTGRLLMDQAIKMAHAAACPGNKFNAFQFTACAAADLPLARWALRNLVSRVCLGTRVTLAVQHGMGPQSKKAGSNTRMWCEQTKGFAFSNSQEIRIRSLVEVERKRHKARTT